MDTENKLRKFLECGMEKEYTCNYAILFSIDEKDGLARVNEDYMLRCFPIKKSELVMFLSDRGILGDFVTNFDPVMFSAGTFTYETDEGSPPMYIQKFEYLMELLQNPYIEVLKDVISRSFSFTDCTRHSKLYWEIISKAWKRKLGYI